MADLGEEAFSSQMKVVATFLRLLEELMRNKQQDLRYGTKTQRRGILGRMKDFVGGIFKKVYDGTFGRLSRNGKDYGQLDLNDPAVAKLFADTMKQMGMDAMHEDNNLLFSTSDVAKILAFSKMVEQELGKKIEHENDTPEKEQSQVHGQDQERQADARGWSDYPATPEQIDLTATVLAADEGVSIDEIKKDFSENPSIGELQIALEAKGHDTMAIQPDLKNYATPEQRAQLDMLKDKGIIGENELMQLGKYPSQDKASEVLENHADAVKMLDSDEISNRAEAIRSHDGMDPDSHTKQVESWKEDLSAKVGNAFEASRDANGQPNLNNFALQCNLRGIAVQFANDGELLFTDANQHHKQVRADNLDPKFSRNSEAFKGQKMSKPLKQKQEEIIKSTDQRNHEHSRAHDSQDHGDAHGSENKARDHPFIVYSYGDGACFHDDVEFDSLRTAISYASQLHSGAIDPDYLRVEYTHDEYETLCWRDFYQAAHGNIEYASRLVDQCNGGFREGFGPYACAAEDLAEGEIVNFNNCYVITDANGPDTKEIAAKRIWDELGDVCIDDNECIDSEFYGYPIGTFREDIWHDIEDQLEVPIHELMFPDDVNKDMTNESLLIKSQ